MQEPAHQTCRESGLTNELSRLNPLLLWRQEEHFGNQPRAVAQPGPNRRRLALLGDTFGLHFHEQPRPY